MSATMHAVTKIRTLPQRPPAWRKRAARLATALAAPALLAALTGCASLGQVQPWEKGNLARPAMTFDYDRLEKAFGEHTYFSKEAANGGAGVGGGGCGCN